MWDILKHGRYLAEWLENNYPISIMIAEFVNTLSNIIFFIIPPLPIYLFRKYGKLVSPAIYVILVVLIVVGLTSAYYCNTLILIGQLLGVIAIIWVLFAAFVILYPQQLLPNFIYNDRKIFNLVQICLCLISIGLAIISQTINKFIQMTLGIPLVYILIHKIKRSNNMRMHFLETRHILLRVFAVFCWISGRFFVSSGAGRPLWDIACIVCFQDSTGTKRSSASG